MRLRLGLGPGWGTSGNTVRRWRRGSGVTAGRMGEGPAVGTRRGRVPGRGGQPRAERLDSPDRDGSLPGRMGRGQWAGTGERHRRGSWLGWGQRRERGRGKGAPALARAFTAHFLAARGPRASWEIGPAQGALARSGCGHLLPRRPQPVETGCLLGPHPLPLGSCYQTGSPRWLPTDGPTSGLGVAACSNLTELLPQEKNREGGEPGAEGPHPRHA